MKAHVSLLRSFALVAAYFSTQSCAADHGCNATEVSPTVIERPFVGQNTTGGTVFFFGDYSYSCHNKTGWCPMPPNTFNVTLAPQANITNANTFSNVSWPYLPSYLAVPELAPNTNYYPFDAASDALDASVLFNHPTNASASETQVVDQWMTKTTTLQVNYTGGDLIPDGTKYTLEYWANVGLSYVKLSGCANSSMDGSIALINRPYFLDSSNSTVAGGWSTVYLAKSSGSSIGSYRERGMTAIWAIGVLSFIWCI